MPDIHTLDATKTTTPGGAGLQAAVKAGTTPALAAEVTIQHKLAAVAWRN